MTTVINTNIASLIAQNNLQSTQNSLTSAITDLSSGLKINSAADDPAGQAIATSLQSQVNGLTQAQNNANNGISLAQTGQSALTQITDNLQTIRTLAVEASNASLTSENRASLNQEVQQSVAQINTIAQTTNFNGENLLDGTFGLQNFQIGADSGQVIGVNLSQGAKASQIGEIDQTTLSLEGSTGLSTNTFNVSVNDGQTVSVANATAGTGAGENSDSAYAAAAAINNSDIAGLTATASNTQQFSLTNVTNTASSAETYNLTINGVDIFGATGESVAGGGSLSSTTIFNAINADSSSTGVQATFNSDGSINLTSPTGVDITVSESTNATNGSVTGGLSNTAYLQNSASAKGTLNATGYGTSATALSTTSGELQGSITLSSSTSIALSGSAITATAAAGGIALQYANTHNSADNLIDLGTTVTGSAAVGTAAAGIKGTSGDQFIVNGQSIVVGSAGSASAEASAIATSISTNSVLKAEGITASTSSTGILTITGGTETEVDITGTASVISSVLGTGASSPTVNSYQAATSGSLAGISVATVADAQAAIETIDSALNQVSTLQGQLGAVQNRFTSVISNLTASTQNASSAQSTIQDTNYASATSQLSRAQVLSQAATAIIAQANQLPQQVLKLLQ